MLQRAAMAVLEAVGEVPGLWDRYVVKGGLALRYAYGSPRQTQDLDFNTVRSYAAMLPPERVDVLHAFCDRLDEGLAAVAARNGFERLAVQYRAFLSEYPVLYVRVGYTHVPDREPPYDDFVELQATLGSQICETRPARAEGVPIRVPALEDIVADKLKVLVLQPLRDTYRASDLFDLWYCATHLDGAFDRGKVVRFVGEKQASWDEVPPLTRTAFRVPAVKAHVARDFDAIRSQLPPSFPTPTVDDAFAAVLQLVDALDLPET